uniref:Uncharacterized protein n=1 Tax=Ditylenchus dipsaci TaxID=166011 RepID=A0A915E1F0_9BILA
MQREGAGCTTAKDRLKIVRQSIKGMVDGNIPHSLFTSHSHMLGLRYSRSCICCLLWTLILFITVCLQEVNGGPVKRSKRAQSKEWLIKLALTRCKIPSSCWNSVERSLTEDKQVSVCQHMDFYVMMDCLDQIVLSRTNATDLNAKTGSVCCETISDVSISCQVACRSALYAPTLTHEKKKNRIRSICDPTGTEGDGKVLNCLDTTSDWLREKYKL